MERRILNIIAQRHKEWHYLTMAFGCNRETAEDIVQNMYIRIYKILQKGTDIMFNKNDVNTFYIIKTLKSIFLDMKRKEKNYLDVNYEEEAYKIQVDMNQDYNTVHERITNELSKLYWFDSKVFDIINSGIKISDLSKKTTIPYYTLYNTYRKVYNHLKNII